jgi:hypothetical protein
MALLKSWDQNAENHTCRTSCSLVYSAGLLWAASLTMQAAVSARLHILYYPGRAGTCQQFLQHVLLIHFLISFMLLTDEVEYSRWHHKLPESPSLRCQSAWNYSITKLAIIFSKYVDGHNSRHIYIPHQVFTWVHATVLEMSRSQCMEPWGQFLEHIGINLQTSIILWTDTFCFFSSRIKWAMLADTLFYTKYKSEKWNCVFQKYCVCVWCEIWQ